MQAAQAVGPPPSEGIPAQGVAAAIVRPEPLQQQADSFLKQMAEAAASAAPPAVTPVPTAVPVAKARMPPGLKTWNSGNSELLRFLAWHDYVCGAMEKMIRVVSPVERVFLTRKCQEAWCLMRPCLK